MSFKKLVTCDRLKCVISIYAQHYVQNIEFLKVLGVEKCALILILSESLVINMHAVSFWEESTFTLFLVSWVSSGGLVLNHGGMEQIAEKSEVFGTISIGAERGEK